MVDLTRTPEPPPVAARALAGLGSAHRYAVLDLQSASAQDLLPEGSVLGWLGALEREPLAEWTDERLRAADVPEDARRVVREQIIQPEEEAEMGQTYQEWAEGHRRKGREELLVRQASRKFGAETGKRLEELVGSLDPEQLVRVGDAVVDCNTGDDLLAEAANGASVAP